MALTKPTLMGGVATVAPTLKPVSTPTPVQATFNDAEVKRKALAGIPLMNQNNPAANNAYNQYKQQAVNARQAQNFAQVDPNQFKTQSATINDIAAKYGFDFSRDYANRQAEAEAQAKRNAVADAQRKNQSNKDLNMKTIDNNLMSQADGLDRNYFQQYQQQAQAQVNGGINGGIAADQDLRMAMARQAAMGDSYRDANLGRMQENQRFTNDDLRLAEELGLVNQQALARGESLYNDRLMQGAGLAMDTDNFNQRENQGFLNAAIQQRGQNINVEQFLQEMDRLKSRDVRSDYEYDKEYSYRAGSDRLDRIHRDREFDHTVSQDNIRNGQWNKEFDWNKNTWTKEFGLETDKFDWTKYVDGQNLGLDRQRLAQDGKALAAQNNILANQTGDIQTNWSNIIKQFLEAQGANMTPGVDAYNKAIDASIGGNMQMLKDKYGLVPPTVKNNPYLTEWDKMKLIGG